MKKRQSGIRRGKAYPAPERSARLYIVIDPSKVHLFRFLLEAHDNLGIMTVVDRWRAVLLVRFSPQQEHEVRKFLEQCHCENMLTIVELNTLCSGSSLPSGEEGKGFAMGAGLFCPAPGAKPQPDEASRQTASTTATISLDSCAILT